MALSMARAHLGSHLANTQNDLLAYQLGALAC